MWTSSLQIVWTIRFFIHKSRIGGKQIRHLSPTAEFTLFPCRRFPVELPVETQSPAEFWCSGNFNGRQNSNESSRLNVDFQRFCSVCVVPVTVLSSPLPPPLSHLLGFALSKRCPSLPFAHSFAVAAATMRPALGKSPAIKRSCPDENKTQENRFDLIVPVYVVMVLTS